MRYRTVRSGTGAQTCSASRRPLAVLLCKKAYTSFNSFDRVASVVQGLCVSSSYASSASSPLPAAESASSSLTRFRFPMTRAAISALLLDPRCTSVTVTPLSSRIIEMVPLSQCFANASMAPSKRQWSVRRNLGLRGGGESPVVDARSAAMAVDKSSRLPSGVWILDEENREKRVSDTRFLNCSSAMKNTSERRRLTRPWAEPSHPRVKQNTKFQTLGHFRPHV
jgi:hypothetical protein